MLFVFQALVVLMAVPLGRRSEAALIEALKRGDPAAWREVMETWGPMLLGYATRLMKNRGAAEEAVQEAMVSVHQGIGRFEGRCSLKSWLFRAVHNKAIDELRRARRFAQASDDEDQSWEERFKGRGWAAPVETWQGSTGARIDAQRVLAAVKTEMENLPHVHRQVLLMKEVHGLSSAEICEVLEISPANLRVSLHRARRALRAAVAPLLKEV